MKAKDTSKKIMSIVMDMLLFSNALDEGNTKTRKFIGDICRRLEELANEVEKQ